MRLTFERGGGGGAGVVAGMVVGLLLCCSAFTRQPPQVAAAALYKLLYRLPHHSAMSLAPQPAALRFRERCRCVVRLEDVPGGPGRSREKPVTRAKPLKASFFQAAGCITRPSRGLSAAPEDRHIRYLSWGHAKRSRVELLHTESLWLHTVGSAYEAPALVRAHKNHARAHNASKIE